MLSTCLDVLVSCAILYLFLCFHIINHIFIYCHFVQVTGFSVGGRVVDGNDVGVDGVKIIVDGQERSVTDKQGLYKLDQVFLS